jgi:hypothetical protein
VRFKHVPEPPSGESGGANAAKSDAVDEPLTPAEVVAHVAEVQSAVPLVPETEDDCCLRLQRRRGYPSRDVSREWLTFLRGLGLAEETDSGFRRTRTEPTVDGLRSGLLTGILGAREVAAALVEGGEENGGGATPDALTFDAAFTAAAEAVPRWERTRTDDWESVWRERVRRLLGWFDLLGMVDPIEGGDGESTPEAYRATGALREVVDG